MAEANPSRQELMAEIAGLRQRLEDLNRAQAVAHTGNWRMNVQTNELTWSEENHRIFGIPPGAAMSYETFLGTVHPEDREYVDQKWMAALRGEPYDIEHRIVVEGQVKWLRERAELEFDAQGQLLGGFGTTQDITQRKEMEEVLKEANARTAAILDSISDSFFALDRDLVVTYYNRTAEKMLGRKTGEVLGKKLFDAFPEARGSVFEAKYREALRTGQAITFEERFDVPPFENWYDVRVYPFGQGISVYFQVTTERKQAEAALRRAHEELEQRVAERTADLKHTVEQLEFEIVERRQAEAALMTERQRFATVLESIPTYVVLISPDCKIPYANREFIRRFGDPGDRLCYEFLFGIQEPCAGCKALEVFRSNTPALWEWNGPDGNVYQIYDYPFIDVDGSPLVLEMGVDITFRQKAEEALKDSQERLRYLAEQLLIAQENERKRLAAALHDQLGHALLVLKLGLRSVANGLLPAQELLKQKALEQLTYIDGLIGEVRRLYHGLSPGNLEDLGLTRALQGLIEDFAGLYDYITWEMELPDLGGLFPESVQTIIYRIFQEALTNIGKHADAGQVRVSAVIKAAQVHFAIQDDGKGFAPSEVQGSTPGVGLAAMEERLNMVGGSFRIWSRKEGGTRISFSIPTLPEA